MIELVFLLVACVLFGLAALHVPEKLWVGWVPAGLFFLALSFLWPHLVLALH